MTLQYSTLFSSNTPVDVYTIIGKYQYIINTKELGAQAGQTIKAQRGRTYYLNLLRTCSEDSNRTFLRRRYVELDVTSSAFASAHQVLDLLPGKCLTQSYIRACGITSGMVCFIEDSIEKLAGSYLAWIQDCEATVEEPVRPRACIILCGRHRYHGTKALSQAFRESCTRTTERTRTYDMGRQCFSNTCVLYSSTLSRPQRRSVNWSLLETAEQHAQVTSRIDFQSLGYYWKEHAVHQLMSLALDFFTRSTNGRKFSIAMALSSDIQMTHPYSAHQKSFFNLIPSSEDQVVMPGCAAPLLGLYMAYHLLSHCRLLDLENFKLSSVSGLSLFDLLFQQRYELIASQLLVSLSSEQMTDGLMLNEVKVRMHAAIFNYFQASECVTKTHLSSLSSYHNFFKQQQNYQRLCTGCFFAYWDDMLPCQHGFCRDCTHNFSLQWKHSGCIRMARCPVCLDVFTKPFQIRPRPPTAGGRVLSLDGGGIKGIVELEILQQLCDLVGGELSIDMLFDMVVGTSIGKLILRATVILTGAKTRTGGIIALGVSVHRWDLNTCKTKLAALSRQVFAPKLPILARAGNPLKNVFKYVRYAANIAVQQSFVSDKTIQALYRQEFQDNSLLFHGAPDLAPIKVAVTACSSRDLTCSIITSYNRAPVAPSRSYKWLQGRDEHMHVKVWEA